MDNEGNAITLQHIKYLVGEGHTKLKQVIKHYSLWEEEPLTDYEHHPLSAKNNFHNTSLLHQSHSQSCSALSNYTNHGENGSDYTTSSGPIHSPHLPPTPSKLKSLSLNIFTDVLSLLQLLKSESEPKPFQPNAPISKQFINSPSPNELLHANASTRVTDNCISSPRRITENEADEIKECLFNLLTALLFRPNQNTALSDLIADLYFLLRTFPTKI